MRQNMIFRSLVVAGVIAGAAAGGYVAQHSVTPDFASAANTPSTTAAAAVQPGARAAVPDFTSIVEEAGAAVVNVSVVGKAEKTAGPAVPELDPSNPFYEFFRQFRGQIPRGEQSPVQGLGSGFIVRSDGLILTNAHVVAEANTVTVKLTDKREFKAKVLGIDKPSDVAVIKIEATNLPTVKIDKSDDVRVGEWVLAIGSPYGFDNTVTSGIVSAKARALPGDTYVPFIQTDVAVNPGNSGGPLFNMKGEVIGINSQIYSRSGGYQGLSFAVPIDVALKVQDQLLQSGRVTRGRLGVGIQDVNQALADSFGLKKTAGALVSSVEKDGPAAKAGIEPGDVIVRYNGAEVATSAQLPVLVSNTKPGDTAKLDVVRKGDSKRIDVTVGELKADKVAAADTSAEQGRLGMAVRPLSPQERQQVGVAGGVVVENVSGAAATAGIQPGDVILSVNNTPIKNVEQLQQLVAKAGKRVALLIQREDAKVYVPIDLG
ncbi:MAG: peptidase [Betaproteobacteria bacterium]|nr:peptidase [Betaproteobacteria bacterium]